MDDNNYGNDNGSYGGQAAYPGPAPGGVPEEQRVMTLGDWLITLIVGIIPCVGIIMYLVWAFGTGNENRRNYCRAYLIIIAVCMVLSIILSALFGAAMFSIMNEMQSYY